MIPDIPSLQSIRESIRNSRMKLGYSQNKLAKYSDGEFSQSLITKFEGGKIDAAYGKVVTICETLKRIAESRPIVYEPTAEEVCFKNVLFISPETTIEETTSLMWENGYSQLPIGDPQNVIGSIKEMDIFRKRMEREDIYPKMPIKKIMSSSFPIIDKKMKVNHFKRLLLDLPAVLVRNETKVIGIITQADLIRY